MTAIVNKRYLIGIGRSRNQKSILDEAKITQTRGKVNKKAKPRQAWPKSNGLTELLFRRNLYLTPGAEDGIWQESVIFRNLGWVGVVSFGDLLNGVTGLCLYGSYAA